MRILKIELENLNSLKGYWSIDLEHPDYRQNHELFVISGPTGAGKTTILDAITLALYGKTPRQTPSSNCNDIMTLHTASCMARVTYRCKGGRFISEFHQRKARDKADGNLRDTEWQVTDAETGRVIDSGKSQKLEKTTEKIIKLNFVQFCSSILLAQGEFDKFLNGGDNPNKERGRAEILTRITGTERFKRIGIRIGEHASAARSAFKEAEARYQEQCKGLLEEAEVKDLEAEMAALGERISKDEAAMQELTDSLLWLEQLSDCTARLEEARKERLAYEGERQAFGDGERTLLRIEKARLCKAEYMGLIHIREDIRKDTATLEQGRASLAALEQPLAEAASKAKDAESRLAAKEKELEEAKPLWEEVRKMDGQLQLAAQSERNAFAKKEDDGRRLTKAYEDQEALRAGLESLRSELEKLDAYLAENSRDEELPSIIPSLSALGSKCLGSFDKMDRQKNSMALIKGELDRLLAKKAADEAALALADGQLKKLISTEYESVARLIREGLEADRPCPVCGSLTHPLCAGQTPEDGAAPAGAAATAATGSHTLEGDIQALSRSCDNARKSLQESERLAGEQGQKLEMYEKQLADLGKELADDRDKLSSIIRGCTDGGMKGDAEATTGTADMSAASAIKTAGSGAAFKAALDAVLSSLAARDRSFRDRQKRKAEFEKSFAGKKSAFEAIDVESIRAACEESKKAHLLEVQNVAVLDMERQKRFGSKDVAAEEAALSRAVHALRAEKDAAAKTLADFQKRKAELEGQAFQLDKRLAEAGGQLEATLAAFKAALERAGITGEEEYRSFIQDEPRYEVLHAKAEQLKERDTSSRTKLETSEKALQDCRAQNKTDRSLEELEKQKKELEAGMAAGREKLGQDRQRLMDNERKKELAEKGREAYEAAREENETWQVMAKIAGKNTGIDLEIFVQALVFKNLLVKANRYLYDITGRYQLVQIPGKVDFKVRDVNFTDEQDDRPASNMSGGEKFIISLSLALGIAEMASQSVNVDSLFLDEGFGTLSGKPLTQAVDALKQLQRSGKMLGIITHVDAVIKEFDQRIEVLPMAGGISELRGSGIDHEKKTGGAVAGRPSVSARKGSSSKRPAAPASPTAPASNGPAQGELF